MAAKKGDRLLMVYGDVVAEHAEGVHEPGLWPQKSAVSSLFDTISWPRDRLDNIVQVVARLAEAAQRVDLVHVCVRSSMPSSPVLPPPG